MAEDETWLNPLDLDVYCNNGTETALHNAVKRREHAIGAKLLGAGANPNLVIYATEEESSTAAAAASLTPQQQKHRQQGLEEQFYFKVKQ